MKFKIVNTQSAYRRLLAEPDAARRQAIFCEELVEPFAGLVQFFGGDGLTTFKMWGMSPEQFEGEQRDLTASIIDALAAHDAWTRATKALDKGWAAFEPYANQLDRDSITFGLYVVDMGNVPMQRGYCGFGGIPGWIMTVYGVPNDYNLPRLEGTTVHELHHNLFGTYWKDQGMMSSLAAYMIGEGLAESFAAELYGEDKIGYYVTDFDESRLESAKQAIKDAFDVNDFNIMRSYIFGDAFDPNSAVPAFTGYALGYRTVQAYLQRTGKTVVEATFVPPREIIEESGFFE
jgi:uncharacterized protein YjaZ